MTPKSVARSLSDTAALLVSSDDVTGTLVGVLKECAEALGADAVGVVVRADHGEVELLSSTSHEATQLEIYQIQQDNGPCLDVIGSGSEVVVTDPDELASRWPGVGQLIVDSGFLSVHAVPIRWQGTVFGALNTFYHQAHALDADEAMLLQTFADVATLAILAPTRITSQGLAEMIDTALAGRAVVEQAKGVLAYTRGLSVSAAYEHLLSLTEGGASTLTAVAEQVLRGVLRDRAND